MCEPKTCEMKPFKGFFSDWRKVACDSMGWKTRVFGEEGYYYLQGKFVNHPQFGNQPGHTSCVLHMDEKTGLVETMNSFYIVLGTEGAIKDGC